MSDLNVIHPSDQRGERCLSLRCKSMYITVGHGEAEHQSGDGNFWCSKTQRIFGPDDQLVGDEPCRLAGRSCYQSNT